MLDPTGELVGNTVGVVLGSVGVAGVDVLVDVVSIVIDGLVEGDCVGSEFDV